MKEKKINLGQEEFSPLKRNCLRILSAAIFVFLIWLTVWGTDMVVNFVTGLF